MTKTNEQTKTGHVKQICQHFLLHSDSGLAHRLQEEEFAVHFDRNRTLRRDSRLGVKTARNVEEEEKRAFVAKQLEFYQQKHKIEENDIALARQLQDEMKIQSNSIDQTPYRTHYHSSDDQNFYEEIDPPSKYDDTSNDEQLARILQEEEQLLSSTHRSRYNSTFV
ncbi:unnamed protein product [Rotaria sp. Silwood1]|nr:unnamed protein product [Rotaria sp. Silwood1]CAF1348377.1 unnamed protein product [Rotaria sp. Silwood1]CAF1349939.1 unnamed protein product [Rotaria sp. Silwood1]CAF3511769.1 unnamed protein product [Rotaria sp. Silwood1]CAF3533280.1 unnamed protein product [Rotaria sp. Silwood1]